MGNAAPMLENTLGLQGWLYVALPPGPRNSQT